MGPLVQWDVSFCVALLRGRVYLSLFLVVHPCSFQDDGDEIRRKGTSVRVETEMEARGITISVVPTINRSTSNYWKTSI